jgi:hypothetical protein
VPPALRPNRALRKSEGVFARSGSTVLVFGDDAVNDAALTIGPLDARRPLAGAAEAKSFFRRTALSRDLDEGSINHDASFENPTEPSAKTIRKALLESMPARNTMPPTLANGKICYIETPATDIARSAEFYKRVFGWNVRKRGDGATSFDDTVNEVSGTWVTGRPPSTRPGLLL